MPTRRDVLTTSSLLASGLALAPLAACSQERPPAAAPPAAASPSTTAAAMLTRPIPSTGQPLPVIGAGTSGSYEVPLDSEQFEVLRKVVRVFFDGGGRLIDTSPNYSNAEDVVGALLAEDGLREKCFLATKLAANDRPALEAQWAASKRRLRTDTVELLQVHNLRNSQAALSYANELKAQGQVRYTGLTHYLASGHAELERLMREGRPDFIQVNYSVNAPEAADRLFPAAQDLGVAVIVNRAFDDGKLFAEVRDRPLPPWAAEAGVTSWAQMFLKFAISPPAVTAVIPATGKPERQADQLRAGHDPLLEDAQRRELVAMFR